MCQNSRCRKILNALRQELLKDSLKANRWTNFTNYHPDLSSKESCLNSLKVLEEALLEARKQAVYSKK